MNKPMLSAALAALTLAAVTALARDITIAPGDSLATVRDQAKSGDRIVLKGGTYRLNETLVLGPQHSGVTWMAFRNEQPVLSGGVPVTGWTAQTNGIWKAPLNRSGKLRQLYVNGLPARMAQRKNRIQGRGGFGTVEVKGDEPWAFTAGKRPDGVKILKTDFPMVAHPEDLEVRGQTTWTMNRLSVRGVAEDGENWGLLLEQPMGAIAYTQPSGTAFSPGASLTMFNAYEFLSAPGEFYFDRTAKTLYYSPRPGEDMRKAEVIAPVLETLVAVRGNTLTEHVTGVRFEGLTFAHTAWGMMKVANSRGDCGTQACALSVKYSGGGDNWTWHRLMYATTDVPGAALEVSSADHMVIERNVFALTGSIGLKLENDVRDTVVEGNVVRDTGGSGVVIGHPQHVYIGKQNGDNEGFGPYNIDNHRDKWDERTEGLCQNIRIANNLIRRTCVEHSPSCGLTVFYGRGITIEHNDLAHAPYSGMSVGWGWEVWHRGGWFFPNKPSLSLRNIVIRNNKIGRVLELLHDGGGLYLLAQQVPYTKDPAQQQWTDVSGNYFYDFGGKDRAGIHPDNGTQFFHFHDNVFQNKPWSLIKVSNVARKGDYIVDHNYANTPLYWLEGHYGLAPRTTVTNNVEVTNNQWPEHARTIMENAGLEAAYRALLDRIPAGPEAELFAGGWTLVSASAEADKGGAAANAIDGHPGTLWHTITPTGPKPPPQEIVVDMGALHTLTAFLYLPRQDGCLVGNVSRCAFYVSEDGKTWGDPVVKGDFDDITTNSAQRRMMLERPVKGRYFKFVALEAEGKMVAVPELGVLGE